MTNRAELKTKVNIAVKKNEHSYVLECDPSSPLGELYDAISEIRGYVIKRIQDEAASQTEKKEEEKDDEQS